MIAVEAHLAAPRTTSPGNGIGQATVTAAPTVTQTASAPDDPTPVNLAGLGWAKRGPSPADQIQMAPSSPGTVYACGPFGTGTGLGFGVSQDGGKTWQTWTTSINATVCGDLKVSPTVAQAVSIDSWTCRAECGAGDQYLHYSLDGGKHWTQVMQTEENGSGTGAGMWIGTTFFTSTPPTDTPASATQYVAVSKNGGPFSWTSLPYPGTLFSNATTLYASTAVGLYATTDFGLLWNKATPSYNGNAVALMAMAPEAAMLGIDARWPNPTPNTYQLLRSTDGGATWQPLPNLSSGLQINAGVLETPDGTIYLTAIGQSIGETGIYKLRPGASQWMLVSPVPPGELHLIALSWDASGHPTSLWGLQEAQNGNYTTIPWVHSA
jgi:hypothetical protein